MKKIEKPSAKVAKLLLKDLDAKRLEKVAGGGCRSCGIMAVNDPAIVIGI